VEYFDVGVWSAAAKSYVEEIVMRLFTKKPAFVFSEDRCDKKYFSSSELPVFSGTYQSPSVFFKNYHKVKPLSKIWNQKKWNKHRTLIVDTKSYTYEQNYGNAIPIPEFLGDPNDVVLEKLHRYLLFLLKEKGSWRYLDKRYWMTE
jgi:TFIIF-interacting CTD phosphatase-like protein